MVNLVLFSIIVSFVDVAIGAPFQEDGVGTVYVYQGSANGLSDVPAQVMSGGIIHVAP